MVNPAVGTVEFEVPAVFAEFHATEDPEAAYELVLERLGEQAGELGVDRRRALTDLYLAGSAALIDLDAIWSGTCVGAVDGRLSMATLTVTRLETVGATPQDAVAAALTEMLEPAPASVGGPQRLVRRFDAPAGPVVVSLEQTPGWRLTGERNVPLLSAKAHLPLPPPLPGVLVAELATPDVDHWADGYAPLLVAFLQSVRFRTSDLPAAEDRPVRRGVDPFGTAST